VSKKQAVLRSNRHFLAVVLGLLAAPALGQEGPVTFEFSFSNPGARSMGLGGAFTAIADDATAAFANPAGLTQLLEPEISTEGRFWSYDTPFVTGGRVSGVPTGLGLDTIQGLDFESSSSSLAGLSFVSGVYAGEKWSLAAYGHVWANFRLATQVDGLFGLVDEELERSEDVRAESSFRVTNYGLSGGYEMTEHLSLGLGVVYHRAVMDSVSEEFARPEEGFFDPNPFTPDLLDTRYDLGGPSTAVTLNGGFLVRLSDQFSVGGVYRQGPKLAIRITEVVGPANDEVPAGTVELDASSVLRMPDVFALGAAFRSKGGALTVSFEWDRVFYSNITESLDAHVFDAGQIDIPDGNEIHLGVEYVFARTTPIFALRVGGWRDPAHGLGSGQEADDFERAIFTGGSNEIHVATGVGLVFRKVQLDFGVDVSDSAFQASASIVYRF
jgi:hypothetical protein